jgi:hypothetical protein
MLYKKKHSNNFRKNFSILAHSACPFLSFSPWWFVNIPRKFSSSFFYFQLSLLLESGGLLIVDVRRCAINKTNENCQEFITPRIRIILQQQSSSYLWWGRKLSIYLLVLSLLIAILSVAKCFHKEHPSKKEINSISLFFFTFFLCIEIYSYALCCHKYLN